jgi:hypothetical protein
MRRNIKKSATPFGKNLPSLTRMDPPMTENEPKRKISKRSRRGEGRPSKRTPEVVAIIAAAIASGLTDREAGILAGIRHDTMTEWRKDPEFSEAIAHLPRAKKFLFVLD